MAGTQFSRSLVQGVFLESNFRDGLVEEHKSLLLISILLLIFLTDIQNTRFEVYIVLIYCSKLH